MTTRSHWVFPRSKLLKITKVGEERFERFLRAGIIPSPDQILWLNPPPDEDLFPEYVLGDLLHLSYLEASGVSTLWELQRFALGAYGEVKYETDLSRVCGGLPCREIQSHTGSAGKALCRTTEKCLGSQRIVSATFRPERVEDKKYLILSRVVLRPRQGPFKVELVHSDAKGTRRRLTDAFRTIMEVELP